MRRLLFFALLVLAFRAGLKLGKWKVREQYFGQPEKLRALLEALPDKE